MRNRSLVAGCLLADVATYALAAEEWQLATLPEPMQAHMLSNMRDHLVALDTILQALVAGKAEKAAEVAEQRLQEFVVRAWGQKLCRTSGNHRRVRRLHSAYRVK